MKLSTPFSAAFLLLQIRSYLKEIIDCVRIIVDEMRENDNKDDYRTYFVSVNKCFSVSTVPAGGKKST